MTTRSRPHCHAERSRSLVRPARIELATLGLGVPCSIQFELRARTRSTVFYDGSRRHTWPFETSLQVFGVCVALSLLAGCGASQPPTVSTLDVNNSPDHLSHH